MRTAIQDAVDVLMKTAFSCSTFYSNAFLTRSSSTWVCSRVKTRSRPLQPCREPARDIPLVTKVMRKEARHTQRRDRASGVPPDILEHLPPKTRVCLLYCFVLSPLTLLGAVPHQHLTLSDKELTYSSN